LPPGVASAALVLLALAAVAGVVFAALRLVEARREAATAAAPKPRTKRSYADALAASAGPPPAAPRRRSNAASPSTAAAPTAHAAELSPTHADEKTA